MAYINGKHIPVIFNQTVIESDPTWYDEGETTLSNGASTTIHHNLGVKPKYVFVEVMDAISGESYIQGYIRQPKNNYVTFTYTDGASTVAASNTDTATTFTVPDVTTLVTGKIYALGLKYKWRVFAN